MILQLNKKQNINIKITPEKINNKNDNNENTNNRNDNDNEKKIIIFKTNKSIIIKSIIIL